MPSTITGWVWFLISITILFQSVWAAKTWWVTHNYMETQYKVELQELINARNGVE